MPYEPRGANPGDYYPWLPHWSRRALTLPAPHTLRHTFRRVPALSLKLVPPDVGPCPTRSGSSAGSVAGRRRGTRRPQSRDSAKMSRLRGPCSPYAYRILQGLDVRPCPRALHRLNQARRQHAWQSRGMGGTSLRSQSCDFHVAAWKARSVVSNFDFSVLTADWSRSALPCSHSMYGRG